MTLPANQTILDIDVSDRSSLVEYTVCDEAASILFNTIKTFRANIVDCENFMSTFGGTVAPTHKTEITQLLEDSNKLLSESRTLILNKLDESTFEGGKKLRSQIQEVFEFWDKSSENPSIQELRKAKMEYLNVSHQLKKTCAWITYLSSIMDAVEFYEKEKCFFKGDYNSGTSFRDFGYDTSKLNNSLESLSEVKSFLKSSSVSREKTTRLKAFLTSLEEKYLNSNNTTDITHVMNSLKSIQEEINFYNERLFYCEKQIIESGKSILYNNPDRLETISGYLTRLKVEFADMTYTLDSGPWQPYNSSDISELFAQMSNKSYATSLENLYKLYETEYLLILRNTSLVGRKSLSDSLFTQYRDKFKIDQVREKFENLKASKSIESKYIGEILIRSDCISMNAKISSEILPEWWEQDHRIISLSDKSFFFAKTGFACFNIYGANLKKLDSLEVVLEKKDGVVYPVCKSNVTPSSETTVAIKVKNQKGQYSLLITKIDNYSIDISKKEKYLPFEDDAYSCFDLSPNCEYLVTTKKNEIFIFDLLSSNFQSFLIGKHELPITSLCWHESGDAIVSAGLDGFIKVWNTDEHSSANVKPSSIRTQRSIVGCSFSLDGSVVTSVSEQKEVSVFDVKTKDRLATFNVKISSKETGKISASDDKKYVVCYSSTNTIVDLNKFNDGTELTTFPNAEFDAFRYLRRVYDYEEDEKTSFEAVGNAIWANDTSVLITPYRVNSMIRREDLSLDAGLYLFVWDARHGYEIKRCKWPNMPSFDASSISFVLHPTLPHIYSVYTSPSSSQPVVSAYDIINERPVKVKDGVKVLEEGWLSSHVPGTILVGDTRYTLSRDDDKLCVNGKVLIQTSYPITSVAIDNRNGHLAIGDSNGNLHIFEFDTKRECFKAENSTLNFDLNHKDSYTQSTPLHKAAKTYNDAAVNILLERGADPFALSSTPETEGINHDINAMHIAAKFGRDKNLSAIIKYQIDKIKATKPDYKTLIAKVDELVHKPDSRGWTALHYACFYCREQCIAILLKHGASLQKSVVDFGFQPVSGEADRRGSSYYGRDNFTTVGIKTPLNALMNTCFKMLVHVGSCSSTSSYNRRYIDSLKVRL
eukprot:TRINITY_DN3927_c0_g1_i2.p1 TRINITY_DN3927_c0_g1~~TRINITY_DN3927_c0_g1_i2.p1  ORF type:complete len:1263 (-),score=280.86 TRINITY_DN3927_c0_g1_i2:523-3828(-)